MPKGIYRTKDACIYVSEQLAGRGITLSERSVLYHIRDEKHVPAEKMHSNFQVYKQKDLDQFVED
jgi:hypothetical protein